MKIVSSKPRFDKLWFALAIVLTVFVAPNPAFAQTWLLGLGGIMCSVAENIRPFQSLFAGLAYIMGAILIGMGLSQLAYFTDTFTASKQYGIARPKGLIVAGACLLALPGFLAWAETSLFGSNPGGSVGLGACVGILGGGAALGQVGLAAMMINLVANITIPLTLMLSALCVLMGTFMVIRGLVKGSKFGQDAKSSVPNIFANIIIGTILFTIGTSMNTILNTLFGDASNGLSSGVLGFAGVGAFITTNFPNSGPFLAAVYAALTFVQLVGMIAFVRGWIIIRDAVEAPGQKTVAQGMIHVIGGALAVNIYGFLEAMDLTFGTGFLS